MKARDYSPKRSGFRAGSGLELAGRRFSPPLWAVLLTIAGLVVFARLGVWQVHRAAYKQHLLDQFSARSSQPPLDWAALRAHGQDVAAFRVSLPGSWENEKNVIQDNQLYNGVDGYHLLTVFQVAGGGAVLVDRGWVAADLNRRVLPAVPPAGATPLRGQVAVPASLFVVGGEDYSSRPLKVLNLDLPALSRVLGQPLAPFVVRLDAAAPDGFGRDWPPVVTAGFGPDRSRGYAVTWFSFMALTFILFVVLNLKKTGNHE